MGGGGTGRRGRRSGLGAPETKPEPKAGCVGRSEGPVLQEVEGGRRGRWTKVSRRHCVEEADGRADPSPQLRPRA